MQSAQPRISWHPGHWCAWCRECKHADAKFILMPSIKFFDLVLFGVTISVQFTGWRYWACWWPFVVPVSCPTDPQASWIGYLLSCFRPPSVISQQIADVTVAQHALRQDVNIYSRGEIWIYLTAIKSYKYICSRLLKEFENCWGGHDQLTAFSNDWWSI
jgi:hypothetical protein